MLLESLPPQCRKWETEPYPDISLLSPLARILGTSVDNLLNFKEKLSEEEIDTLLTEADKEFEKSNVIEAINTAKICCMSTLVIIYSNFMLRHDI